ncbi:MAG: hypothetical protein MRZ90_03735 [Candidatus Gastranaerophilales bacterium]|nr:hypothetical protein [Candidatus Gastranaerophilales bacterium]
MFYNVLKAKNLASYENNKFERNVLMENNDSSLSVVALKKDEIIDTHTSLCNACVYILEGKIEIHFNAEKFTLNKDEMLLFKKDEEHKVFALENSKFLLIKI